jgi:REP element-mobilizing transposase RayT
MPRRPRFCPAGMPVHVVQRGNNRQVCFAKEADMIASFANWLGEAMATEVLGKIRACLEKGLVLGTDRFREQVVSLKR